MKLSDWAHIAEILGGIAIIASLIFVGIQINENSLETRSATFQAMTDSDLAVVSQFTLNPDLALDYYTFRIDPESLTVEQSFPVSAWIVLLMRQMENVYEQYQAGIVPEARWQSSKRVIESMVLSKGGACWVNTSGSINNIGGKLKDDIIMPAFENSRFRNLDMKCPPLL